MGKEREGEGGSEREREGGRDGGREEGRGEGKGKGEGESIFVVCSNFTSLLAFQTVL